MRDQAGMPGNYLAHSQSVRGLTAVDGGPEEEEWSGVAATMYEVEDVSSYFTLLSSN
jgi:hypothetical protein